METEQTAAPSDTVQERAYKLFIEVSTGLHGPEIVLQRLKQHLRLRGFDSDMARAVDIRTLSDDAAREALSILPELYRPAPGADKIAKLF